MSELFEKYFAEELAEARAEGFARGFVKGFAEDFAKDFAQSFVEDFEEDFAQSFAKSFGSVLLKAKREKEGFVANIIKSDSMALDKIAEAFNMSLAEVQELAEEIKD
ncbi:MAG: hypothetical protein IJS28_06310 [Synergistaceae bacterium]|nr:hypothetical protein [Synergistaceae bacterium]